MKRQCLLDDVSRLSDVESWPVVILGDDFHIPRFDGINSGNCLNSIFPDLLVTLHERSIFRNLGEETIGLTLCQVGREQGFIEGVFKAAGSAGGIERIGKFNETESVEIGVRAVFVIKLCQSLFACVAIFLLAEHLSIAINIQVS